MVRTAFVAFFLVVGVGCGGSAERDDFTVDTSAGGCDSGPALGALIAVVDAFGDPEALVEEWADGNTVLTVVTATDQEELVGPDEIGEHLGAFPESMRWISLEFRPGIGNPTPHLLFSGDAVSATDWFVKGAVSCTGTLWSWVMTDFSD